MHKQSPLEIAAKGAIAGLVGTAAITVAMRNTPVVMQQLGLTPPPPPKEEPPAKLAENIATEVFDTELEEAPKAAAGQAIHWSYGTFWGAFYGLVLSRLGLPPLLKGTLFGALIGGIASTAVPALRLTPPPTEQPPPQVAMQATFCLLYGWVTAVVFAFLTRE